MTGVADTAVASIGQIAMPVRDLAKGVALTQLMRERRS